MALPENPISREEHYLSAIAGEETPLPAAPITREEHYLAKIAGEDVNTPRPITRKEHYLDYIAEHGSGGVEVEALDVTENGTYTAPEGKAYSPVTVDVPNPSTGTLEIAENGTYDVTDYASAEVDVPAPTLVTKSITANGTYSAEDDNADGYSEVTVSVSGGGGGVWDGGVIFIDYDGTELERWPSAEVADKTALPDNPTNHPRLVAQGWNWTLTEIKDYIEDYPEADVVVGQMYKTASGLTEFDISLNKVTGLDVTCNMTGDKDWGDGTQDALTSHTYADYGEYTITCDGTSITSNVFGTNASARSKQICISALIGERVASIGSAYSYTFQYCDAMTAIVLPSALSTIIDNAFYECCGLRAVVVPRGVTSISQNAFFSCRKLTAASLPCGLLIIGYTSFKNAYALSHVTVPATVTTIVAEAFSDSFSIQKMLFPTSITSISNSMITRNYAATEFVFVGAIASVGSSAFSNCRAAQKIDLSSCVEVPTLASDNAFSSINGQCKIIVPDALYDNWIVATNWATYADYIHKASEV